MKTKYKQLTNNINKFNTIYLFRHVKPDPDALGSIFGLKEIINDNFKKKQVILVGKKYPVLSHLFPKSSNINKIMHQDSLAIICDTANSARVDCNEVKSRIWRDCKKSFKIDHHKEYEKFTDYIFVQENKVSTCEMIIDWARSEKFAISKKAATFLYYGLIADSGRFMFPNTTSNTLRQAATLFDSGIDISKLHQKFYTKKFKHGKILAYILQNVKIKNKVGYIFLDEKTLNKLNFSPAETKLHANALSSFEEIDIWVLAIKEDGEIKISSRSKPKYRINKVAMQFQGGGHKNAAGAKVKTKTELMRFINALVKLVK